METSTLKNEIRNTCHNDRINDIQFPYEYSGVFGTCGKEDIRIWNSETKQEHLRIHVPNLECYCFGFIRDGKSIYSGWHDEGKKGNSNINCGVDNHLLKEKINRIYMLIQKCNMNKNCLDKMNKFMNSVNNLSHNSYQPLDFILDVVYELLSKIQEEYSNKNELINKLKNISLNK